MWWGWMEGRIAMQHDHCRCLVLYYSWGESSLLGDDHNNNNNMNLLASRHEDYDYE